MSTSVKIHSFVTLFSCIGASWGTIRFTGDWAMSSRVRISHEVNIFSGYVNVFLRPFDSAYGGRLHPAAPPGGSTL